MFKFSIINIERLILSFTFVKNNYNKNKLENDDLLAKHILCSKIDSLYLHPDFEFENMEDFQKKSQIVLKIMRGLIREFPCENENQVAYLAKNFEINSISGNDEFYDELLRKELRLDYDLSIFNLGLRSISTILSWNLKKLSVDRISKVKTDLKPIVVNFNRKELLFN